MATDKYQDILHRKLHEEYQSENGNNSEYGSSLELDLADDTKYKLFGPDQRIVIYGASISDMVKLRDNGLCCQFLANWSFWNFSGKKGDKINKLIHRNCPNLEKISVTTHKTAKKKYKCYPVTLSSKNGGDLYSTQNVRCILNARPPSMNPNMTDYESNEEKAYSALHDVYSAILESFYSSTELVVPSNDSFIAKDAQKWDNKSLIKKEVATLTQKQPVQSNKMSVDDDGNNTDDMAVDMEVDAKMNDDDALHFSLKPVPRYSLVQWTYGPLYFSLFLCISMDNIFSENQLSFYHFDD